MLMRRWSDRRLVDVSGQGRALVHVEHDSASEPMTADEEMHFLREENRRLKGLLEIREDRSELERYQIQSRNRLVSMFIVGVFAVLIILVSAIAWKTQVTNLNNELGSARKQITQMKNAAQAKGTSFQ